MTLARKVCDEESALNYQVQTAVECTGTDEFAFTPISIQFFGGLAVTADFFCQEQGKCLPIQWGQSFPLISAA